MLDEARLRREVGESSLGARLVCLPTTGSTQDEARRLARSGAPHGTVVVAGEQTAGRGRLGRRWISPAGAGLWFTVILQKGPESSFLPLLSGVAVAEALREVPGASVHVKWPNDVLLDGRKVAGILIEADSTTALLGIGVNVNLDQNSALEPWRDPVASLHEVSGAPLPLEPILARILHSLDEWLRLAREEGPAPIIMRWRELASTLGRRARIVLPRAVLEGVAEGIDETGALLLRMDGGEQRRIAAGDVIEAPRG